MTDRIGTHSPDCWSWGPQHYECALAEIARLRAAVVDEGEAWSWIRRVMSQGADIKVDYDNGKYKCYEEYSARLDAAAAERAKELPALLAPSPTDP